MASTVLCFFNPYSVEMNSQLHLRHCSLGFTSDDLWIIIISQIGCEDL